LGFRRGLERVMVRRKRVIEKHKKRQRIL
jgi:hypothetical protein